MSGGSVPGKSPCGRDDLAGHDVSFDHKHKKYK